MYTYAGKTALITGASSGIGEAFARELAGRGMHVVLVARSEGKLRELAQELSRAHNIRAEVIASDLTKESAAEQVYAETVKRGVVVDMLVNNAGFGTHRAFEERTVTRTHDEITLNVTALAELTQLYVPSMLTRGDGAVINVASTAAFQPLAYMSVYGATKAFVVSFSEALWAEYRGRGVRVLALCPGATATNFFSVASNDAQVGETQTPAEVVAVGLRALERNRSYIVSGWSNYFLAQLARVLPRPVAALVAKRFMEPRNNGTTVTEGTRTS